MSEHILTDRQRGILECIEACMEDRGFPPSVREIGDAVGLTSPSTVHNHLNTLQRLGFLERDPNLPRAIKVNWDRNSGAIIARSRVHHVPLIGDVAAGTDVLAQENVEELLPLPADFTGEGDLFMLRVRGDSMIDAHICDGDTVVLEFREPRKGDVVAALIDGETILKRYVVENGKPYLHAENENYPDLVPAHELVIQGVLVALLRSAA